MKKIIKYLIFQISLLLLNTAYADSCLDKNKTQFDNKKITFTYDSNYPLKYFADSCSSSYQEITQFLKNQYLKQSETESWITLGWNYLAINNRVVYDFMAQINPAKIRVDNDDLLTNMDYKKYFNGYTADNQAEYRLISIINRQYACYYHQQFSMVDGMAHPYTVNQLLCTDAENSVNTLKINQVVKEDEVVYKLLQNNFIRRNLTKKESANSEIKTYNQLGRALVDSPNLQLSCVANSINESNITFNTGFSIDKLNSDGTIDITLGLTSDIHVCSQIFIPITLTNLKPLMKIYQVLPASNL